MCSLSLLTVFILREVETYVSCKESTEYLLKNYAVSGPIVSSKPFARGVRYYTQKEIVVLDLPGKNYFSPHPVTFLYNDEKVKEYLRAQSLPVYCILKKANVEDIERVADKEFKFAVLNKIGNEYIVKIEPNKKK